MKRILFIAAVTGLLAAGCGKGEEELPAAAPAPSGASVNAADPTAAATPAAQAPEPFDPNKFGPPPPPAADFAAAERPLADDGSTMKDIDYLNAILFRYNESRATYSPEPVPQFKTPEEQRAYDQALMKLKDPITDLNELVRAKVIKAIPAAPAGKKYAVNGKTFKVELVDANAPAAP